MTKSDPNAILHSLFSAAWGQALPSGKDTFLPLAMGQALSPGNVLFLPFDPITFIWIRPDPDIIAAQLHRVPSLDEGCMVKKP